MSDSFQRDFDYYTKPESHNLYWDIARAIGKVIFIISIPTLTVAFPVWCVLGFPWPSSPGPLRLFRDHEAEITVYAQRAIAGNVGNQPDPRNGLLLEKNMLSYDVKEVHVVDHCLEVEFNLPWFDGPIWSLVYAPTMTNGAENLLHPSKNEGWKLLEYKDLGHGWHYVSQDSL